MVCLCSRLLCNFRSFFEHVTSERDQSHVSDLHDLRCAYSVIDRYMTWPHALRYYVHMYILRHEYRVHSVGIEAHCARAGRRAWPYLCGQRGSYTYRTRCTAVPRSPVVSFIAELWWDAVEGGSPACSGSGSPQNWWCNFTFLVTNNVFILCTQ